MTTTKKKTGPKPRKDRSSIRSVVVVVRMSPVEVELLEALMNPGEGLGPALRRLALDDR